MPVFNGENYLRDSIESIIHQTFTDWEFIIINEYGSNATTNAILQEYAEKDTRIVVIQNEQRLGISASLNVGINQAKGEYIARMDGDDISLPERIEKQVSFMDENTDIGLCGVKVSEFGTKEIGWSLETDKDQLASDILFYSPCVHPTVMFRKDVLDKYDLRYNEHFPASEDYELFSRLSNICKVANLDEVLFKYRIIKTNTTFKVNDKGIPLYSQVIATHLEKLGLFFSPEEIGLLSPHVSVKQAKSDDVYAKLIKIDLLLKKILVANEMKKIYSKYNLSYTLHKRFKEACQTTDWFCTNFDRDKVKMIYDSSIFSYEHFRTGYKVPSNFSPTVTVLMPTYNSEAYIAEAIMSVLKQDYEDFEFLIINEFESNDDTIKILNMFEDERIRIIQNTQKLGLADSLNVGIIEAKGKYIARLDADDLCAVDRLRLQVEFMENNPDYGVCGGWQHHFGVNTDFVHRPPTTHEELKAHFMFRCELCHSTLMLRKSSFIDNNLFYDKNYAAEDYELWTRAIHIIKFANLPRILGEYRVGEGNITLSKMGKLHYESGEIAAKNISAHLNVSIPDSHIKYFGNWYNEFNGIKSRREYINQMQIEKKTLSDIWNNNKRLHVYDNTALLYVLNQRWRWVNNSWRHGTIITDVADITTLLGSGSKMNKSYVKAQLIRVGKKLKKHIKGYLKFFFKPIYRPIWYRVSNRFDQLRQQIWDLDGHICDRKNEIVEQVQELQKQMQSLESRIGRVEKRLINILEGEEKLNQALDGRIWKAEENIIQSIDGRIWNAELNLANKIEIQTQILEKFDAEYAEKKYQQNLIPRRANEKIRIVFLFQVASFWPSWESFYKACINNEQFDVKLILLDDVVVETVQIQTARTFLKTKGLPFVEFSDINIDLYQPHIMVFQTPYDKLHRKYPNRSLNIKAKGIRIVYIPYGIEFGDTSKSRNDIFNVDVVNNAWRVFTLSEKMVEEYKKYSSNYVSVRSVGSPKFDGLYNKEKFMLPNLLNLKENGKKVCLWKVHFPNTIKQYGKEVQITPYLKEYLLFAEKLKEYSDFFFLFMPHPKFMEACKWIPGAESDAKRLFSILSEYENVAIYKDDDYRSALVNADYMITDRSAIMVEAGALDIPVLYMYNCDYQEPMNAAITPLIESYYQGVNVDDMIGFLEMCKGGNDYKKEERRNAFHKCVPYFDGECGNRIAQNIIADISADFL
jgi:glycosyltransferase involved in cell wall biosynthesis